VITTADVRTYLVQALMILADDTPTTTDADPATPKLAEIEDAWDVVQAARAEGRASGEELARSLGDELVVLRGDRGGADDPAVFAVITRLRGRRAIVFAMDRRHYPGPGAFRKVRRCLRIAENLGIPVVTLIDTRGADPSSTSENLGIAWAIARTTEAMLSVETPTVAVVTGEGGSGGALALAATDRVLAYEHSIFSVIGPELAATILWRDAGRAAEAARLLHLTAADLQALGIADELIPEPLEGQRLTARLAYHLDDLGALGKDELLERRAQRWRGDGNRQTST
jgi:acetyl-CoA carboxylase alpha subunit